MKIKFILITSILFSLYLTGCAKNNANDDVAYRNRNGMEPTRVNYNTRNAAPLVTDNDRNNGDVNNYNRNNVNDFDRNDRNYIDVRNNNRNNNNVGDNGSRMRVADKAVDRVTDLREVDSANVIVTDNNAYVAAKLENNAGNKLTKKIERKISNRVKSVDHDIDNVYVSVNPDFYDRMNNYANDIRTGRPVSGFFDEFTTTIRRIFPDVK
jgi:spore cortex protein